MLSQQKVDIIYCVVGGGVLGAINNLTISTSANKLFSAPKNVKSFYLDYVLFFIKTMLCLKKSNQIVIILVFKALGCNELAKTLLRLAPRHMMQDCVVG